MRDMEIVPVRRGSLDFLYSIRKRKKKTLWRITGKFRDRRDDSLRCSRSDQRFLLPIIQCHPSSFPTMNPKADHRSIDSRARSIRRLRSRRIPAELINGSSQFPSCEICPPLKTISSSEISQPPFLPSLSCSSSSPFISLFIVAVVVMLFYFSSYSRIQFCVLLPPVTLAENNNNICSPPMNKERQWFDPCCS